LKVYSYLSSRGHGRGHNLKPVVENPYKTNAKDRKMEVGSGALLTVMDKKVNTEVLKDSLNPLTVFKLDLDSEQLPSAIEWSIR